MQKDLVHILVGPEAESQLLNRWLSTQELTSFVIDDVWEFLRNTDRYRAKCLILDINLPGLNGLDILERARSAGYRMPLTIMVGPNEVGLATRALKQGAFDYLPRPLSEVAMINAVMTCLDPTAEIPARPNFLDDLSKRENEVLNALAMGKNASEVADYLGVKTETIHFHTANMRKKADVGSTRDLLTKAAGGIDH